MKKIEIKNDDIKIDGKSIQIISGAIHYFRIHPDLWDDRLDKAVAFGLNCIETYIPWNIHEPHRGEFCFEGICDFEKFIDKVHERNLKMILRPGPYICAEWDNGGIPAWVSGLDGVSLRCMNEVYIKALTDYFDVLLPKITPKLYSNGGPVIMMQVENEYGSYGNDHKYMQYIADLYRKHGIDVPLATSDGPGGHFLLGGSLPDILTAVNFGGEPEKAFANLKTFSPDSPKICMEFWNGWFDHWGGKHHTRGAGAEPGGAAEVFEKMLASGAHVNFYMFHGGTNFGFTNGANGTFRDEYIPTVTSYDYDCPLNEYGDASCKFESCQKIIAKYSNNPAIKSVKPVKKICPANVKFSGSAVLLDNIANICTLHGHAVVPPTMEKLGENFGFIHYRTRIDGPMPILPGFDYGMETLNLFEVNDYAMVWLDGKFMGHRMRDDGRKYFELPPIGKEGAVIDILVENCGRKNYGTYVGKDFKGIVNCVSVGQQKLVNWDYNLLPMADLSRLEFAKFNDVPATFHFAEFEVEEIGEAFVRRPGTKGAVWVNGFNLGRYWNVGPTETLYIPSPVLKKGRNEIIVLELEKLDSNSIVFSPEHLLGETE